MSEPRMEQMRVGDLKGHEVNKSIRKIGKGAMDRLAVSIDTFGCVQPIVWHEGNKRVVSGHQRLRAYEKKHGGDYMVDVWIVDMDEDNHKMAMFTLNNHVGEFDGDMIRGILKSVEEAGDIPVESTGYSDVEVDQLIGEIDSVEPYDELTDNKSSSILIFENGAQKAEFENLRTQLRDSAELATLATNTLKAWST